MDKQILTTGIRPTGELHLGNYFGALKNLINLQQTHNAYFFIVDLHSLTTHPKPGDLRNNVLEVAKDYLAAGLDSKSKHPLRPILHCRGHLRAAHLPEHGDATWRPAATSRPLKKRPKNTPDNINYGLVGYPVLMAADILIHKGTLVPVGEDQLVHLEMARTITRRFNALYGDVFPEPQPFTENAVRIPSLSGQGKMSKSDATDSYISLKDDEDSIRNKVKKAFSDPRTHLQTPTWTSNHRRLQRLSSSYVLQPARNTATNRNSMPASRRSAASNAKPISPTPCFRSSSHSARDESN